MAPLMGTTEEMYSGGRVFYYVFGGKPLPDWSGIKYVNTCLLSDLCYRSLDPISGQKITHYHVKGLVKKFDRTQKLSDFQKNIWEHLTRYELDTIGYLPDPKDPTKVQPVITYGARFIGYLGKPLTSSKEWEDKFELGIRSTTMKPGNSS